MPETRDRDATLPSSDLYGPEYYAAHCGPVPYARTDHWLQFFGGVADVLVRSFAPRRVFDAGCAIGLLVEALWDRGVEAHGRDISDWAITQVRADVRPWCEAGSIADPVGAEYDLITCIEVLEHMPEDEAVRAIQAMAAAAPRILFSSSPTDLDEPTHVNVRPPAYWLALWAEAGFAPSVTHDAGYLAPHAYVLERSEDGRSQRELVAFADRVRHRVALSQVGNAMHAAQARAADAEREKAALSSALAIAEAAAGVLRATEADLANVRADFAAMQVDLARMEGEASALRSGLAAADAALGLARRDAAAAASALAVARTDTGNAHSAAAQLQADAEAAHATTAVALAGAGAAKAEAAALRFEAESARRDAESARHDAWIARSERRAVMESTAWRATGVLRHGARLMPRPVRRLARQGPKLLWWAATFQLAGRLRDRRNAATRARLVAGSPLFDAAWYLAANPDVAISGIPPALHYATRGGPEGRDPGPGFHTSLYLQRHPEAATQPGGAFLHALTHDNGDDGRPSAHPAEVRSIAAPAGDGEIPLLLAAPADIPQPVPLPIPADASPAAPEPPPTPGILFARRFPDLSALPVFAAPHGGRRLTVVTDSINAGSLYGGVGTALILAALSARRLGASLRLVTRIEPPEVANVGAVLDVHGISWDGNIEFLHAPRDALPGVRDVPASSDDLFLTTSWWTTWSTRQSVPRARIAYLLQEDERMFYPLGDDHLRCSETLSDPGLLYLVNSELLLGHLRDEGLAPGATAFEPSFPNRVYRPDAAPRTDGKRGFFFYARPHNVRNLYWRGLEALCAAIEEGVLDPADWDFHFAGHGAGPLSLPRGAQPLFPGPMAWQDYAAFVARMDVGLSLMYTPHPSYPPLDLAASGAIVVTNRFGRKRDLDQYSPNILCADPDVPSLVGALRRAVVLASDRDARAGNLAHSGMQRDWKTSMAPALDRLAAWAGA